MNNLNNMNNLSSFRDSAPGSVRNYHNDHLLVQSKKNELTAFNIVQNQKGKQELEFNKSDLTIKDLKKHISSHYPNEKESKTIRIIFQGKELHDHEFVPVIGEKEKGRKNNQLHIIFS